MQWPDDLTVDVGDPGGGHGSYQTAAPAAAAAD